jgi:hypothetical protein
MHHDTEMEYGPKSSLKMIADDKKAIEVKRQANRLMIR